MSETLWQKFHVGQRVWCKDDSDHPEWPDNKNADSSELKCLKAGEIYTIRQFALTRSGLPACHLVEIIRPKYPKTPWSLTRFEPVREQNIEIFRKMCREADQKVRA